MKIQFIAGYSGGAYWKIEYKNKKTQYVIGFEKIKKIINNSKEKITLEKSLGYEEHSQLIELIKSSQK